MNRRRSRARGALLALFLLAGAVPFLSMLIFSFFARWPLDAALPQTFTLDGFRLFFRRDFGTALRTTLFSLVVSLVTLLLCIPAARGLLGVRTSRRRWLEALFCLPMLLPVVCVSMGSHKLFLALSFTGSSAVFVMHVYFSLPYVFQMVYACYAALGVSTETAARNLGVGWGRIFWRVHLPAYLPGYASAYAMGFIVSYSQYFVNFYLGGADDINFSMVLAPLITGSNRNVASVYTLMYLLFGAVVLLLCSVVPGVLCRQKGGARHGDD